MFVLSDEVDWKTRPIIMGSDSSMVETSRNYAIGLSRIVPPHRYPFFKMWRRFTTPPVTARSRSITAVEHSMLAID